MRQSMVFWSISSFRIVIIAVLTLLPIIEMVRSEIKPTNGENLSIEILHNYFPVSILSYTIDWQIQLQSIFAMPPKLEGSCMECHLPPFNRKSNSSPKDLVLGVAAGSLAGFSPFIRSLRSTGCKATVAILVDNTALSKLSSSHKAQFGACGVYFINIGSIQNSEILGAGSFFLVYIDFLSKMYKNFDRVLLVDTQDVVFQGDPFVSEINWDAIHFSVEFEKLRYEPENTKWVKATTFYKKKMNYDSPSINAGMVYGSAKRVFEAYSLLISLAGLPNCDLKKLNNQGMFNAMIMSDALKLNHVPYEVEPVGDPGVSLMGQLIIRQRIYNGIGYLKNRKGDAMAATIHGYDRLPELIEDIENFCPQNGHNISDFVRYEILQTVKHLWDRSDWIRRDKRTQPNLTIGLLGDR